LQTAWEAVISLLRPGETGAPRKPGGEAGLTGDATELLSAKATRAAGDERPPGRIFCAPEGGTKVIFHL
jgi:hypothetical protein